MQELLHIVCKRNLNKEEMLYLLESSIPLSESDYKIGQTIVANNKMDKGQYSYKLTAAMGDVYTSDFNPEYSPRQMLEMGVFEGKYINDCIMEFPKEWFIDALKSDRLSPERPDINCNRFKIKSRQSLPQWIENDWIYGDDNRGWFQWYCRYWLGRRDPEIDQIQIKRWRAFSRHYAQVQINCKSITCRPKQRQALLQWSWKCD
jgi:hypothetical protein